MLFVEAEGAAIVACGPQRRASPGRRSLGRVHALDSALRSRLAKRLAWQQALNDPVADPRNRLPVLRPLQQWQSKRLTSSFADMLADPRMHPAARFFLTDLYGDRDFSARDRDAGRILPLMSRLLPESLLRAAVDAIELAVLSHAFDLAMADRLSRRKKPGAPISEKDYAEAYREVGCPRLRRRQIRLIGRVGADLDAAVKKHGVHRLLRASRIPAQLAGLSELQSFLERGFSAFAQLGGAGEFLGRIDRQEREVSRRLFAGEADPFRVS